jgi:hypothetical protein
MYNPQNDLKLTKDEAIAHMQVLRREINILKSRITMHDSGHLYTTINVLEERCGECMRIVFAEDDISH